MNAFNILVRAGTMLAVLAGTPPAEAEPARPCADRAEVVARLAERFGDRCEASHWAATTRCHTKAIRIPYAFHIQQTAVSLCFCCPGRL